MSTRLSDLWRCFQGVIPSIVATSDSQGIPNVTYASQVYLVDEQHVALSCQFFNKTRKNLDQNPSACAQIMDPVTLQAYLLRLRFLRSEKSGPLFDTMSLRIDAIASHTGMAGVFRLIAADVFEVRSVEKVQGFLTVTPEEVGPPGLSLDGLRTEIRGLQWVSERINRAADLESLLTVVLEALEEYFKFSHTSVLLYDEPGKRLITMASRGYGRSGIGAEVPLGEGLIGTVAVGRRLLRLTNVDADLRYGRAIRREASESRRSLDAEIPLPGLPDAQSILAIPLAIRDRLVGVLVAEDRDPMRFGEWDEAYLEVIANQIALGLEHMIDRPDEGPEPVARAPMHGPPAAPRRNPATESATTIGGDAARPGRRRLTYYRSDDAIFVDDEYLIRNVPARILWKVLGESSRTGRTEFSNREMRLDASLGLPPVKDNLESRLILLRHRLKEKCPDLQIVSAGRGKFALRATTAIEMVER
jgi:GAF domain-containing protein/pyridoxamine 5'-phosphate oxidase-like protein